LRRLAQRFQKLFERETALYKQIVSRIGSYAGQYKDLVELFQFVEERTSEVLGLRRVKILVTDEQPDEWVTGVLQVSRVNGWLPVEDNALLTEQGFKLAYPLRKKKLRA
jgi:hypothetical protein